MGILNFRIEEGLGLLRQFAVEKPLYLLLAISLLLVWGFEKWVFSVSTWVPLLVSVWATIQYATHQRKIAVEDLTRRWKRAVLEASPMTSVEHCEWLNKLIIEIWPNYYNPMLSVRFKSTFEKRLETRIPSFIESIEIKEFSLGSSPPNLALDGVRWSTLRDQKRMHLSVEWDTCLTIVLQAKLAKPLKGTAQIVISRLYIKGDLLLMPILQGKAILYSFLAAPVVRIEAAFGKGSSQSLLDLFSPSLHPWLGKLFSETLAKTMVEPRRQCFPLSTEKLRKKAVAGIILVTVVGANQISHTSCKGSPSNKKQSFGGNGSTEENLPPDLEMLVEVQLEQLTRRTDLKQGSSPRWNSTFNMVLHNNSGILKFHLYECTPGSVKYDYQASCEIKLRYCEDGSTIFWAFGPDNSTIANRASCGQEVEMTVPFEKSKSMEISVKLLLQEWHFADGSQTSNLSSQQGVGGSNNSPPPTGRKVYVTVAEAKNLARKDKSGKINPYVQLHYGKTMLKTRTVSDSANPVWNKRFEFEELGGGEYLTLRCYSEETIGREHMGSARVNLERLNDGSEKDEWIPLEKVNSGDIRLVIEAVRIDSNDGSKGSSRGTNIGWIELVLIEAKDLIAADLRGTSDPYVKVEYGNVKKRTKVMYRTLNPHWNQTLEFPDDGRQLKLYVKDHNDILASSDIGECEIEYERLPLNQTYDKWIPLQGVTKGEIHVLVTRKLPGVDYEFSSFEKAHNISCQRKHLTSKLQDLVGYRDLEGLSKTISELEALEDLQEQYILQLEIDKSVLHHKVVMLDEEMSSSTSSSSPSLPTLTRHNKSLS